MTPHAKDRLCCLILAAVIIFIGVKVKERAPEPVRKGLVTIGRETMMQPVRCSDCHISLRREE
jgi:hypothetical protein